MALSGEQKRVARKIYRVGRRMGASKKEMLAAIETGLVESGLRNLSYGDRDSVGWRQERGHYGSVAKRRNVAGGARRFFSETKQAGPRRYGTAGQLAQAVQRSAFPERYDQMRAPAQEVLSWLGRGGKGVGKRPSYSRSRNTTTVKTVTPGVSYAQERKERKLQYLQERGKPGALLGLASDLGELKDVPRQVDEDKFGTTRYQRRGTRAGGGERRGEANIQGLAKLARNMGLTITSTTGGQHVPGSYHYTGNAIDVSGPPNLMKKYYRKVLRKHRKGISELFYDPGGTYLKHDKPIKGAIGGHADHVHVATERSTGARVR